MGWTGRAPGSTNAPALPALTHVSARTIVWLGVIIILCAGLSIWPCAQANDQRDHLKVGVQTDGRIVVPTDEILKSAGTEVTFAGRPVDLAFAEAGKVVVVKNSTSLILLDVATTGRCHALGLLPENGA